ncbi:MAG TPA: Si-specific NAD(P)(+) transhydrogenase [Tepidisphaeraceae bacterium]|nr:Si-specific NAD(P)(+) transhydrogenase [Tepidisphaeraceae bacterium]
MSVFEYDLVVIGGGPAGEKGAAQAAYFGHRTAVVERAPELGGACINTGTIASKTLRESALFLSGAKARQLYGIDARPKPNVTLSDFMYRKNVVRDAERLRARRNLDRHGIERITGTARIGDPHTVLVTEVHGSERRLSTAVILIATGSTPARPPNVPFNPQSVFDSDTVLEMTAIPQSMVVIGGGVIGCEYAGLFNALGVRTTLVHRSDKLLDFLDEEISDVLMSEMASAGVEMVLKEQIDAVEVQGPLVRTTLKGGRALESQCLLYCAGRSGNTRGLGLEALGISTGKYGHVEGVDPRTFRTAVRSIYAAGDVIGPPALASTSMEQARLAMVDAFGLKYRSQSLAPILPMGIYTIPEISAAGESEQSCREKGIDYVAGRSRYGQHARGQIIGDLNGLVKLIFSSPDGKLLGVHIVGEQAAELVHIGTGCLHFGGTIEYFIESVFNYPTLSDVYKYAAFDALAQLNIRRGQPPAPVHLSTGRNE